eukprot:1161289-Pelagomonas_calceolata.AAC.3
MHLSLGTVFRIVVGETPGQWLGKERWCPGQAGAAFKALFSASGLFLEQDTAEALILYSCAMQDRIVQLRG